MAAIQFDPNTFLKPLIDFEEAQRMRAYVINAYSGTEYLLTDFIVRANVLPNCQGRWASIPGDFKARADRAKKIIELEAQLKDAELIALIDELLENYDIRNVLAHGLCARPLKASVGERYVFRKWNRQPNAMPTETVCEFTLEELSVNADQFGRVAEQLTQKLRAIYATQGWTPTSVFDDH